MSRARILVALIAGGVLSSGALASDESPLGGDVQRCDFFIYSGATTQATPEAPFVGTIDFTNLATGDLVTTSTSTVLLGIVNQDPVTGTLNSITSHDIATAEDAAVRFSITTFDEQTLIPLEALGIDDPDFDFGLIGRLFVKAAGGRYSCGEIVSGFDGDGKPLSKIRLADPTGQTGQTELNGFAKLCRCDVNDN